MRLAGRVAPVTGAQQGIGAAIALAYGREGASVVVNYLDDQTAAAAVVAQLHAAGREAVAVAGDVARLDDVQHLVEAGTALGALTSW